MPSLRRVSRLPARPAAFILAAALGLAFPVAAQAQQKGIAFSYAPEQGSGMCRGEDAAQTIACAQRNCVENGGDAGECAPVAWCYPSGWSVAVGLMHREGIHWSEYSCGWPSREAALAGGKVLCDLAYRQNIEACVVAVLWDEEGNEILVDEAD
ncbi:MAG: hypothetical protein M9895_13510 [Aquamicrobium sp.]|jgi:hypothetical protein|uniref:hypothetical protein n=1 Tax=Aquamicrobium sp. TaxID=1872579 RepID=UPI00349E53D6|nr:hypothetical protein [Aquamicrobium sp.]MCO5157411.1 hypothetical protein [Aquamicrobium sp.]